MRTLLGFFLSCQGAYGTFLFQDPSDHQVTGQYLGTGDSSASTFQLQRTMGAGLPSGGFAEPILAPDLITAVYLDGITQSPSSYSADPDTGLLSFATPPATGLVITADFSYWFRCRFVDDSYDFENFMYRLWQLKKLTFISVRP